jgi:NAD(P)-dependent dehydrogenase (short-subunit alcohol dehydrogenase family)
MKNLFDVSGETALVTGGSRGIGEMIAQGFVANGVKTCISSRKAAIHHLTRTFTSHLADRNITANAIAPGPFPSKMTAGIARAMGEEIRRHVRLKRWGGGGGYGGYCDIPGIGGECLYFLGRDPGGWGNCCQFQDALIARRGALRHG